ncbi:MAG: hypothetical protein WCJ61_11910 [Paludibacter sp.]
MNNTQLISIIKEFSGRECTLRLTSGEIISGVMGNTKQNILTNIQEVGLWCGNNIDKHIPLGKIEALKVM